MEDAFPCGIGLGKILATQQSIKREKNEKNFGKKHKISKKKSQTSKCCLDSSHLSLPPPQHSRSLNSLSKKRWSKCAWPQEVQMRGRRRREETRTSERIARISDEWCPQRDRRGTGRRRKRKRRRKK